MVHLLGNVEAQWNCSHPVQIALGQNFSSGVQGTLVGQEQLRGGPGILIFPALQAAGWGMELQESSASFPCMLYSVIVLYVLCDFEREGKHGFRLCCPQTHC